jgi:hypothetical protein
MRDAVREHFANPPPGSKLRAAIDFGVDISMMDPPQYNDRSGYRADRGFREILNALSEHEIECIIVGGVALILHGSTRMTFDIDILLCRTRENVRRLLEAIEPLGPKLRLQETGKLEEAILNGSKSAFWTPDFDIDLMSGTAEFSSYESALAESEVIETNGGRKFRILSLDALLRIAKRRNRVDDQLALPEIEALLEVRELERSMS